MALHREKYQTLVRRNRCRLDGVLEAKGLSADTVRKLEPDLVVEIVKEHWTLPAWVPPSFPANYPPVAPLLDVRLPEQVAVDLRQAFTQNNVTYARHGPGGNIAMELFGDKHTATLLARHIRQDLKKKGSESFYHDLDLGGLDYVFRQITCGVQQSFFAMIYNFPARICMAYKQAPSCGQQIFSQRDMEGTFEAYLEACDEHVEPRHLLRWFDALISPWIPGIVTTAREAQITRDGPGGIQHQLATNCKSRHSLLERRPAPNYAVGMLPVVYEPTIEVLEISPEVSREACEDDLHYLIKPPCERCSCCMSAMLANGRSATKRVNESPIEPSSNRIKRVK